jgi:hypothetical protein
MTILTAKTKVCKICELELNLENFSRDLSRKDKLSVKCKDCCKIYYKENKKRFYLNQGEKLTKFEEEIRKINLERFKFLVMMMKLKATTTSSTSLP